MDERQLVFEEFSGKVGQSFVVCDDGLPAIAMELRQAQLLNPAFALPNVRSPFSLTFIASDQRILPQGLYRLDNQGTGIVTIFLVPAAKDASGVTYHATFN
ncbi:MAG TPA: hypothetical protein VH206_12755 [Xanthobacteraceae bacterium]|nr:hypothetical protein [Xanthobacteraceae bacterium]